MRVIDADGHVNDRLRMEEVAKYMPKGNQFPPVFPELDHLHTYFLRKNKAVIRTGNPGPKEWIEFIDNTGIEWTVVYPTSGLAVGRIVNEDWAIAACKAYNNWLYDRFLSVSPRIKGMALIPLQNVDSAVEELNRAVKQLGMLGAMLPSNGEGLKTHLGSQLYWPLYEEAEKLNCALGVHGGCHHHLGLDSLDTFFPVQALGHPFGIMVQAAGMLVNGVFDRFPGLRVAFLEGGTTWVPFLMDRLDRSYEAKPATDHVQVNLQGEFSLNLETGEKPGDYFKRHVKQGRIYVGFDSDDDGLGYAIQKVGREPFVFASDFPHEAVNAETCNRELGELISRNDLTEKDKDAILAENVQRLYGVTTDQRVA